MSDHVAIWLRRYRAHTADLRGVKNMAFFLTTCPNPDCCAKNHSANKYCSECGFRLYPSKREIETARRINETA